MIEDCNCSTCQMCQKIPFCCTLTLAQGLEFDKQPEQNRKQYIKENLVVTPDITCLICKEKDCSITEPVSGCNDLIVSQLFIKGCIPFAASVPGVINPNLPDLDPVSICSNNTVCITNCTPVCLGCITDCTTLEINNIVDIQVKKIGNSCGNMVFEVKGEFVFNCQADGGNGGNGGNGEICGCKVTGSANTGGNPNERVDVQLSVCTGNCDPEKSSLKYSNTLDDNDVDLLLKQNGPGKITKVSCNLQATQDTTTARIEGTALVTIEGTSIKDELCSFILEVTDNTATPPTAEDTVQMIEIRCNGVKVFEDNNPISGLGQSINIQPCNS